MLANGHVPEQDFKRQMRGAQRTGTQITDNPANDQARLVRVELAGIEPRRTGVWLRTTPVRPADAHHGAIDPKRGLYTESCPSGRDGSLGLDPARRYHSSCGASLACSNRCEGVWRSAVLSELE